MGRLIRASELPPTQTATVEIDWSARTIDIYGAPSSYTKEDPYQFAFDRVRTAKNVAEWMAHIGEKTWSSGMLYRLSQALLEVYESHRHPLVRLAEQALPEDPDD